MRFIVPPLLIIGMFTSFSAAVVAMLFFTGVISTPQELTALLGVREDASRLAEDLDEPEVELARLTTMMDGYRQTYEAQLDSLNAERDSLALATAQVMALQASLQQQLAARHQTQDSVATQRAQQQVNLLIPSFNKIKAADAAAILAEGSMSDTLVARLMIKLQPHQVARIMGSMDVAFAAHITRLMSDVAIR